MQRATLLLLIVYLVSGVIIAQDSIPEVVGVRDDQLLLVNDSGTVIFDNPAGNLHLLDTNASGAVLFMDIRASVIYEGSLYIYDGTQGSLITDEFIGNCPAYFADDEHIIYVGDEYLTLDDAMFATVPIIQHNYLTNESEQIATLQIPTIGGGGGGSGYLMDHVYVDEYFSNGWGATPNLFQLTGSMVLYGRGLCGVGLKQWDGYNSATLSRDDFVALSADETQFVTVDYSFDIGYNSMQVVDIATSTASSIDISDYPVMVSALHWAQNGMIYLAGYTTITPYTLSDQQQNTLSTLDDYSWYQWDTTRQVFIYQINPETSEITPFYDSSNSWVIARLSDADDYLYWSQIPDATDILEAINTGDLDNNYSGDLLQDYLLPDVYRQSMTDGDAELIAEELQRFLPMPSAPSDDG